MTETEDLTFYTDKHIEYVTKSAQEKDTLTSVVTAHLKMSGIYWGYSTLMMLNAEDNLSRDELLEFILSSQNEDGGFGGSKGHDSHILYTLSAIQLLSMLRALDKIDSMKVLNFILPLIKEDGSVMGDRYGEIDARFSYCCVQTLYLLRLPKSPQEYINIDVMSKYIAKCQNIDGGFGNIIGSESHAGMCFVCVAALSIMNTLNYINIDKLSWWIGQRQVDSGGLNGRPEKQADLCYSWWALSVLDIIGRMKAINSSKLLEYILRCQDPLHGGLSDRPNDEVDVYHTYFGITGLNMLGFLKEHNIPYKEIDPSYALPKWVLNELNLHPQTIPEH
ncbi:hypothetical protein WA158_000374 [Blastocystis sp. Blastoise]